MDTFYVIVLSIAILFLIFGLTAFAVVLRRAKKAAAYPPTPSLCPDGWSITWGSDGTYVCTPQNSNASSYSVYNNGKNNANADISSDGKSINFSSSNWKGPTGICNRYKWATTNNAGAISWDGVTNVNAPC